VAVSVRTKVACAPVAAVAGATAGNAAQERIATVRSREVLEIMRLAL